MSFEEDEQTNQMYEADILGYWDDEDYDDDYDDWDYDEDYDDGICSPQRCGDCWGGDGLCMAAIQQQAEEHEEFYKKYVHENTTCPGCQTQLKERGKMCQTKSRH